MSTAQAIDKLNEHLGIANVAEFRAGPGDLTQVALRTATGHEAHVFLHGAHVSHFQPAGHQPVLFMSERSKFEDGQPIRGGVPICFPWFANKADDPAAPSHGFARTRAWKVRSLTQLDDGGVRIALGLDWSPRTKELWPHAFAITHTVTLSDSLSMQLEVTNHGQTPFVFEEALHTYFAVSDVRETTVTGLKGATYIDKVDGGTRKVFHDEAVQFTGETDSAFPATNVACVIHDPGWSRTITVDKEGSWGTIVWNPWIEKAKRMADFGDDEWPKMVCVETANFADSAVTLQPGVTHLMLARIRADHA